MNEYEKLVAKHLKIDKQIKELQFNCKHDEHGPDDGTHGHYISDGEAYSVFFCKGCGKNWGKIQSEKNEAWP